MHVLNVTYGGIISDYFNCNIYNIMPFMFHDKVGIILQS